MPRTTRLCLPDHCRDTSSIFWANHLSIMVSSITNIPLVSATEDFASCYNFSGSGSIRCNSRLMASWDALFAVVESLRSAVKWKFHAAFWRRAAVVRWSLSLTNPLLDWFGRGRTYSQRRGTLWCWQGRWAGIRGWLILVSAVRLQLELCHRFWRRSVWRLHS